MAACVMYSDLFNQLYFMQDFSPKSSVDTLVKQSLSLEMLRGYYYGSAFLYTDGFVLKEVVSLTLLNPSPPPPGPSPPPPALGPLKGSVTHANGIFSFSITISSLPPDMFYYAFFTADGAVVYIGSNGYSGKPTTWSVPVADGMAAFASYVQVKAVQISGGGTPALTLTW